LAACLITGLSHCLQSNCDDRQTQQKYRHSHSTPKHQSLEQRNTGPKAEHVTRRSDIPQYKSRLRRRPLLSVPYHCNSCTGPDRFYGRAAPVALPREIRCHCKPDIHAQSVSRMAFSFDLSDAPPQFAACFNSGGAIKFRRRHGASVLGRGSSPLITRARTVPSADHWRATLSRSFLLSLTCLRHPMTS
jgi:hypothetical protein